MSFLKTTAYRVSGVIGLSAICSGAALGFDIVTNDFNSNAMPPELDITQASPNPLSFNSHQTAHIYIQGADLRADNITAVTTDGQPVEFSRVYSIDDNGSGFTASAYLEENKNNVIIIFNGMSKPWHSEIGSPHENPWQSWNDVLTGVESRLGIVNRQMPALYEYMSKIDDQFGHLDAQYQTITYSLGGIHGFHALAEWNIPHTGLSPAGFPAHNELYTDEEIARISDRHSVSYSTPTDFVTGSAGRTGNLVFIDDNIGADSIGRHTLPTGYLRLAEPSN